MNELKKDLAELEDIITILQRAHSCEITVYNSKAGLTVKAEVFAAKETEKDE